ncbi:unnamed protein product [Ilex paraguariensis]|uniref:Cleavage and polyadenylation specificity factor subunit 3 n=1 Tax=Ilex paraguariensis TaxID=185542 RepID=A0ABC8U2N5_9AQUA
MAVYQTYVNAMNERIRNQFATSNPFDFKHISALSSIENFNDVGPSVVMASPGGLQSGLSRQLFDKWCSDKKNACVIPGYAVEGTLAKTITTEPKEVTLMNGLTVPLNMQVHYVSFSAHADYAQTSAFLEELMPSNIILVHGEANEMGRLKQKLISLFADGNTKIISPKNCQSVEMYFNSEKMAKTIGRLAEKTPEVGETVGGLLVKKGFTYQIMAPDDLHVFSQLSTANVTQRITIPYSGAFAVIKHRLKQIYESVECSTDEESGVPTLRVHDCATVKQESEKHILMHWTADPISDMVSDSIVALALNASREMPKVVVVESEPETNEAENEKKAEKIILSLLVSLFGDVKLGENGKLVISVDGTVAHLDKQSGDVESENEGLKERTGTECSTDEESGVPTLRVHDCATVKQESEKHILMHWTADPISDMVSDSIVALALNASREMPKVVVVESEPETNEAENEKKAEKIILSLLVSLFGDVKVGENGKLVISVDGTVAHLDKQTGDVESENEGLKERVKMAFRRIQSAMKPIPHSAS